MTKQIECSVCRLYVNRKAVGMGFLVRSRHIITCAHTIVSAPDLATDGSRPDSVQVLLDFPLLDLGEHFTARVCHWRPDADVAGLKMAVEEPLGAQAVSLITADDLWGHPFCAFGCPPNRKDGVWASGVLRGRTKTGWVQMDDVKVAGYWVQRGFSGTPVWDEQLNGVIGMVVATDTDQTVKAAYVIPAGMLAEAWPGAVRVKRVESPSDRATTKRPGSEESGSLGIGDVRGGIRDTIIAGRDVHVTVGSSAEPRAPVSALSIDRSVLATLRQVLSERFHLEELRTLCFDLGIDWDDLPAQGKAGKVRELVSHFAQRRRIEELIQFLERRRPDISWSDIGEMLD